MSLLLVSYAVSLPYPPTIVKADESLSDDISNWLTSIPFYVFYDFRKLRIILLNISTIKLATVNFDYWHKKNFAFSHCIIKIRHATVVLVMERMAFIVD